MALPPQFKSLEKYRDKWATPELHEVLNRCEQSSYEELKLFHDDVMRVANDILKYLDSFKFNEFGEPEKNLANIMFSFSTVSTIVEIYRQSLPINKNRKYQITEEPNF